MSPPEVHDEDALLAHAERMRSVIAALDEGFVVQAADGAILVCNPSAERILGLSADQMTGRTSLDPRWRALKEDGSPFPGDEHPAMVTLRTGRPLRDVIMGVHTPDGELRWITIASQPYYEADRPRPAGVATTFRDVTAARRADAGLRRSESLLTATLENLPAGVCVVDEHAGTVLRCNDLFGAIWELGPLAPRLQCGAASYRELAEHCRSRLRDDVEQRLRREDLRDAPALHEDELALRDGRTLRRLTRRLVDAEGRYLGRLFLVEDVTRRVRAEEERRTLERRMQEVQRLDSLGVLAGGIAHDFNNLLTSIIGNAEMAAADAPPGTPLERRMERVLEASARATELCRRMLSYAGAADTNVRRLHLTDVVHGALHWLQPQISTRVHLHEALARELPAVFGDPLQLNQLVVNLAANAAEALPPTGGNVWVSTGAMQATAEYLASTTLAPELPPGEYVFVEVRDDGCGMDDATRARMFEPFFTTKFAGRGLGLSAALGIVRSHRGALRVDSRPGAGTSVRVLLPSAQVQP